VCRCNEKFDLVRVKENCKRLVMNTKQDYAVYKQKDGSYNFAELFFVEFNKLEIIEIFRYNGDNLH